MFQRSKLRHGELEVEAQPIRLLSEALERTHSHHYRLIQVKITKLLLVRVAKEMLPWEHSEVVVQVVCDTFHEVREVVYLVFSKLHLHNLMLSS